MVPTTTDYNVGVLKTACDAQWNKHGKKVAICKQCDKLGVGCSMKKKINISDFQPLWISPNFTFWQILEPLEILYRYVKH